MEHYRREMTELLNEGVVICRELDVQGGLVREEQAIRESLNAYNPAVMFYGLYNSGKSTLINALLSEDGSEVAETADRPCTSVVKAYPFGDYLIYDTPGIDAPQEHERISREQLKKAQVVLFVVSTDGSFDEEATVREVARIWKSGRPVIVVLNDKSGADRKSAHVAGKQEKLLENLVKMTGSHRVREEIDFVLVNAKTGMTAKRRKAEAGANLQKQENADRLWEHSGVGFLGDLILRRLLGSEGTQLLLPAYLMLKKSIEETRQEVEGQADDGQEKLMNHLREALKQIELDFIETAQVGIQALRNMLIGDISTAILAEAPLEHMVEQYQKEVEAVVHQKAEEALRRAQREFLIFEVDGEGGEYAWSGNTGEFGGVDVEGASVYSGLQGGLNISAEQRKKLAGVAKQWVESEAGKEVLKKGLLKLRKLKIPGFKGRWERTLGRWAGKLSKGIGVGIQVLAVAYEIWRAKKDQSIYEETKKNQRAQVEVTSKRLATDVERHVNHEIPSIALDLLRPFRDLLEGVTKSMGATDRCRAEGLARLEVINRRLHLMGREIKTERG